jgi:hypothetical protein
MSFEIQKATRQGILHLPFPEYQLAEGVNKSLLDKFAECPAAAMVYLMAPQKPTQAMVTGWLVDIAVFEPHKFADSFYLTPETYTNDKGEEKEWCGRKSKFGTEWYAEHEDKPCINSEKLSEIRAMADAIAAEPKAECLMSGNTQTQVSLFATDKQTGLQKKGRPDVIGEGFLADLKCSCDYTTDWISKQAANMRWHVQAAYYTDLARACGRRADDFYFIVVHNQPPHFVNVRRLEEQAINLGRDIYQKQLVEFKKCVDAGLWPGPSGEGKEIGIVDLPAWEYNKNGEGMDKPPLVLEFAGGTKHAL